MNYYRYSNQQKSWYLYVCIPISVLLFKSIIENNLRIFFCYRCLHHSYKCFAAHFMHGVKRQPTRLDENFLGNWNTNNCIHPSVSTTLYIINFALYNRTLVRHFINPFSMPYLFGSLNNYIKSKCYSRCSMQTLGPWSEMWFCQFSLAAGLYY